VHPYRDLPTVAEPKPAANREETVMYGLAAGVGAIPVTVALESGASFGFGAIVGSMMLGAGALGLTVQLARALRRRSRSEERGTRGADRVG
jgi:hypothetical protein